MKQKFIEMQKKWYDRISKQWSINNLDPVVGNFKKHNNHKDYEEFLFKDCKNFKTCLDFACGPGRNIVLFNSLFEKFDGVDISQTNLDNAAKWINHNGCDMSKTDLFLCNGSDLSSIPDCSYDVVMSTIALQHICVHEIRFNYFKEFYRVLKNGGRFTAQMGYGPSHPESVGYYENNYSAPSTNGACDTRVESHTQLETDLKQIGFKDFKFYIRPVGPGDRHNNWIFFSGEK